MGGYAVAVSKVELVVLGLLAEGPRYGYELLERFRERGMDLWAEVGRASVYQALQRLEREGALAGRQQDGSGGPDRRVYRITSTGRARLRAGLREQARRQPLPLGFLHLVPADEAARVIATRAEALEDRRGRIAAARARLAAAADPANGLALRLLELQEALAEVERRWLEGLGRDAVAVRR